MFPDRYLHLTPSVDFNCVCCCHLGYTVCFRRHNCLLRLHKCMLGKWIRQHFQGKQLFLSVSLFFFLILKGQLLKKRICSAWSKFFTLRVDTYFRVHRYHGSKKKISIVSLSSNGGKMAGYPFILSRYPKLGYLPKPFDQKDLGKS